MCVVDVNECTERTHNCGGNGLCTNTNGSYRCKCHHGYRGNDFECSGKNSCLLQLLFKLVEFSEKVKPVIFLT